jgi:hypothetical protein
MNSIDAAYATVHDYPGGSESLGPRVNISAAVLRNKVNPSNDTHHLTFTEARRIVALTGDRRMLQAWAHEEGFLMIKAPEGRACDMAILEQIVELGVTSGQFMQAIYAALADGRVDGQEIQAIKSAELAVQTAAATVTKRMEGMVE